MLAGRLETASREASREASPAHYHLAATKPSFDHYTKHLVGLLSLILPDAINAPENGHSPTHSTWYLQLGRRFGFHVIVQWSRGRNLAWVCSVF